MKPGASLWMLTVSLLAAGCGKTTEEQMQEYLEFYYPTTGQYSYEINFDWGSYLVVTGPTADEPLHPDSEPYRGYIVMRPRPNPGLEQDHFPVYLITPKGDVYTRISAGDIPETTSRDETVVEETEYGTTTQTTTITSPLEPVVHHFLGNRDQWTKYGIVQSENGASRFKRGS